MTDPNIAVQLEGGAGQDGGWGHFIQQALRSVLFFFAMQTLLQTLSGQSGGKQSPTARMQQQQQGGGTAASAPGGVLSPMWFEHDPMDMYVYLTESSEFTLEEDAQKLIWEQHGLQFDWSESNNRDIFMNVSLTPALQNNGSAYAHVVFTRHGARPDTTDARLRVHRACQLNTYRKQKKVADLKSLLGDTSKSDSSAASPSRPPSSTTNTTNTTADRIVSYWKPDLSISLVHHFAGLPAHMPGIMLEQVEVDPSTHQFYPIIYHNEFWLLSEHLIPLNETIHEVPLKITYTPIGMFKWQLQLSMGQQMSAKESMGLSNDREAETIKRMFLETNPILLAVTMIVSCLHMLFDLLAFRNDISFWHKNKSMEGLSLRTIMVNTFFQLVIFLYLLDNETSWMVLFSSGAGLLIDIWKAQKGVLASLVWRNEATGVAYAIPRLKLSTVASYRKSKTQEYDEEATAHLMFIVAPLMVGYAAYSLVHERHKSFYSWIVTSLTGFVYVFGFVMMTPQLYLNYRLKSVAHLPWRTLCYKFLNTIIDDLFAFVIKMPTMHRLSCFRDDIIFLIYCYQRWAYRVDKSRLNEFGQITDDNKASEEAQVLLGEAEKETADAGVGEREGQQGEGAGATASDEDEDSEPSGGDKDVTSSSDVATNGID